MAVTDIRDLLGRKKDEVKPPSLEETQPPAAQTTGSPAAVAYVKLKNKLHHRILEKVDLVSLESMSESKLREEIATLVELLLPRTRHRSTTSNGACWCAISRTRCWAWDRSSC